MDGVLCPRDPSHNSFTLPNTNTPLRLFEHSNHQHHQHSQIPNNMGSLCMTRLGEERYVIAAFHDRSCAITDAFPANPGAKIIPSASSHVP